MANLVSFSKKQTAILRNDFPSFCEKHYSSSFNSDILLIMKTILVLTYATRHELTPMLNGINYVAHKEKDWNVHVVDVLRTRKEVRDLRSFWKPAGCLVHCAMPCAPFVAEDFGACPAVFIDQDPELRTSETWHVIHDSANAGRLAAQELLAQDSLLAVKRHALRQPVGRESHRTNAANSSWFIEP